MLCGFCGHPTTSDVEDTMKYRPGAFDKSPKLLQLQ